MLIEPNIPSIKTLTKKYPDRATMYVEYPHKKYWQKDFGDADFRKALLALFARKKNAPLLLYIHIPFCPSQCFFCNCYTFITNNGERIKNYLHFLYQEIDIFNDFFQQNSITPNFREVHLGGGSPTMLEKKEFDALIEKIGSMVDWKNVNEFSIEVDPRRADKNTLEYYHKKGINRISVGVQDFDSLVQKAVNRIQPIELTQRLIEPDIRSKFSHGYSFDIICGLPWQTRESIQETFKKIVAMSPDRVCFNYFHYTPEFAKHQQIMIDGKNGRPTRFPNLYEKKLLFLEGQNILENNGYWRTGYDHFAKPTDEVGLAMQEKKMHWNALGVTAGRYDDVIALGLQSFGSIQNSYYQNFYEFNNYENAIIHKEFPIYRGYTINRDDEIRRDVIQTIRNFFYVRFSDIEKKYDIIFKEYFRDEVESLKNFIKDGILASSDAEITLTDIGRLFADQVCKHFDTYSVKHNAS